MEKNNIYIKYLFLFFVLLTQYTCFGMQIADIHSKAQAQSNAQLDQQEAARALLAIAGVNAEEQQTNTSSFAYPRCDYCYKSFETVDTCKEHMQKHIDLQCPFCNYQTLFTYSFKIHLKHRHKNLPETTKFLCAPCNFRCIVKEQLIAHIYEKHQFKHEARIRNFACPKCPESFAKTEYLFCHLVKHAYTTESEKSHNAVCFLCEACFDGDFKTFFAHILRSKFCLDKCITHIKQKYYKTHTDK